MRNIYYDPYDNFVVPKTKFTIYQNIYSYLIYPFVFVLKNIQVSIYIQPKI